MEPVLAYVVSSVRGVLTREYAHRIILYRKKIRKIWVRDWVARRHILVGSNKWLTKSRMEHQFDFMNYMVISIYYKKQLETCIQKQDTFFRGATLAKTKLEITFRFLATGESYSSLQYSFSRVKKRHTSVCIWFLYKHRYYTTLYEYENMDFFLILLLKINITNWWTCNKYYNLYI